MTIDELTDYGMERMTDDEIEVFLKTQSLGVLGLPTEGTPYLIPLSYGYDGGSTLYFVYVVGAESRKATLSDRADTASFLVYSAETMFHWRSVLATGSLRRLSDDERSAITDAQTPIWRPELLETASEAESTRIYELTVDEWTGIRHAIAPPTFAQRSSRDQSK
ncbi:pyridoxamine 5'-phosphate oxidase family protein [Halopiger xanaduensis]|uniref:Pyridoxamine 5'-phosphate oxidase-related FMN-binding protein n=1 Tax=Halopiger xanaduensis (strain DSM 18323 / JCM 14033 / SH-6) TaxID=797210 RepID=F8DE81_HALXS|nr:pyridoxamine 5'-phosphate oxidase family protein [Halopiger xanaduensis]AEH39361.1 pyridoxamine 5'-phosphate oxidase-related FMN-binding protein [Halopiger xanaduensis SH-6]